MINEKGDNRAKLSGKPLATEDGLVEVSLSPCLKILSLALTGKKTTLRIKTSQQMPESILAVA